MAVLSLRKYASRRRVALSAVQKAIKSGRLRESVMRSPAGRTVGVDVELANVEWQRNTDPAQARSGARPNSDPMRVAQSSLPGMEEPEPRIAPSSDPDINAAHLRKIQMQNALLGLRLRRETGDLVLREEMEREATALGRRLLNAMLSACDRLAPEVSVESSREKCRQILRREVTLVLSAFADDAAGES